MNKKDTGEAPSIGLSGRLLREWSVFVYFEIFGCYFKREVMKEEMKTLS